MDFNERVIPGQSSNFLFKEALARYVFAQKIINKGTKILDLGCGTGYGAAYLSKDNFVTGVDISEEAIKFAKKKYGKKVQFQVSPAEKIPYPDNTFDAVVCFEVIEHIKEPQSLLKEIKRVSKKNAIIILSTPNIAVHSPDGIIESRYHEREYNYAQINTEIKKSFKQYSIYGQTKSRKAKRALVGFQSSQEARQKVVDSDILKIRRLIPKRQKEILWKFLGHFFGRSEQNKLDISDFPISRQNVKNSEYFVIVCKKAQ